MQVADVVAEVLRREGIQRLIAYPSNPIIEACAKRGIRPVIVRQERTGIHIADGISRVTSGQELGVFAMQFGPGAENSFGAVAQAFSESVPILVLASGYPRAQTWVEPNFSAVLNYRNITKSSEQVALPESAIPALRRAFTRMKNGQPGPALIEFPVDVLTETHGDHVDYSPAPRVRTMADPLIVKQVASRLATARLPVIYAGQGVHFARAWSELIELANLLGAPVVTSLAGKSAFPEDHPLSLGTGGRAVPAAIQDLLEEADIVFGAGCSFTSTTYGVRMPPGKPLIQLTVGETDLNKDLAIELALIGDAKLTMQALIADLHDLVAESGQLRAASIGPRIAAIHARWLASWRPKLESSEVPLSPYRVIWDLMNSVDRRRTVITHDAGSPRDQLSPFWQAVEPLSYLGWGKTTQLGTGLGLIMGAKLACPEKLCINVWGDAAIGMTGMDFETAVREHIPILSILLNNSSMAIELATLPVATEMFGSTNIGGNYSDWAIALGGYGERVEKAEDIVPAVKRGIQATETGRPGLLEFITAQETEISRQRAYQS